MSWRRSPLVTGCATVLAVASLLAALAVWNRRAIRSWLDPSYRDPSDLSAVEQVLRARYGTTNLSVFWTTRTPFGSTLPPETPRRRRVSVHVVGSERFPDAASADAGAQEIARAVREAVGHPAPRIEVVLLERAGPGWRRRSFWFEGQP